MSKVILPIDDCVNLEEMSSSKSPAPGDYLYQYQNQEDTRDTRALIDPDRADDIAHENDHPSPGQVDIRSNGVVASVNADNSIQSDRVTCRMIAAVIILFIVNLLNYTDRFTIAGVLPYIKKYYGTEQQQLSNADAGLLQTSFILFYMVFSPIFGFLGDRMNRTILMSVGILAWSMVTLASSFIPENMFWLFVVMRGMVGIGEASYSTIAPTIIADMFSGDNRTKALTLFFFAIPVGSGLGYIIGAELYTLTHHWQYALRFTPALGVILAAVIFFLVKEPPRGASDGGVNFHSSMSFSSWLTDIKYLLKNKSYMLSTLGFTCVAFCAGALAFWAPIFMDYANKVYRYGPQWTTPSIALVFGLVTCTAGIVGVLSGTQSARILRRYYATADPIVCAAGMICCAPFLFLTLYLTQYNFNACWVFVFIGSTLLCLNWAVSTDILLYVVVPQRRSTGEAFQILIGHTFGDAGSPYLVGVVSDSIKNGRTSDFINYLSLQYALYMMSFVAVLGGGFYLATSLFLVKDRDKANRIIHASIPNRTNSTADIPEVTDDVTYNDIEPSVPT